MVLQMTKFWSLSNIYFGNVLAKFFVCLCVCLFALIDFNVLNVSCAGQQDAIVAGCGSTVSNIVCHVRLCLSVALIGCDVW